MADNQQQNQQNQQSQQPQQGQQNQQNKNTEGTTGITGSQITSATGNEYQPTGNAAAQGAMSITGSITTETPDKYAGGAPKDVPQK